MSCERSVVKGRVSQYIECKDSEREIKCVDIESIPRSVAGSRDDPKYRTQ